MSAWHCVHVQYYDPDKDDLILDAVRPLFEQLRPYAERLHLARHWRRGPHVRLFVKTDPDTWTHVVRPHIHTVIGDYLEAHPSTFVPDFAHDLAQHRLLAHHERDDGPLTPWLPDNTVHEQPYDSRLHVVRSPETAELMAAFASDTTSLLFTMLSRARNGQDRKDLMALELMLATSATARPPITRSFVSYRSHAEGYLHACDKPDAIRQVFEQHYHTHRQSYVDRTRAVLATLAGSPDPTPLAHAWATVCREYAARVAPLITRGLVFPPLPADPPPTPPRAPMHALMFGNRAFRRGVFADPGFLRYRFLLNCTYLQINRLGLTPYERMRTCHATANAVEEIHGISAIDMVQSFVNTHPNTPQSAPARSSSKGG
ncbi:thiopeptide maturation pyridine synthase [Saccharothrix variisporea]|uniref:Lantibiotic biosynthesis dehydratase-like protein n=1 Tax=Saccharothrix variisporea TaxID=543527 RepID=A0A495WYH0_9PSEU|nr:thiopeptide maturation pyridine synthase [Saccharothrix variisporea]RKT66861.1 lantibiotic biosynthesis dehydratase-like protein [Saccharothrix variisporea]